MITNTYINQPDKLKNRLKDIPNEPGCYLMIDAKQDVIYIGKSKNLRSRVGSYFRSSGDLTPRIKLMVRQIQDIEFIVTDTESEALVLESNLIKEKKPYFNILLKDDKKYPYLCITWSDDYPRLFITRRRRNRNNKDRYYGPYVDVGLLRKTLFLVKRAFPLRQRPIPLYKDKTCLNYSIGRCPGVCQEYISPSEYHKTIQKVEMVFQGRSNELKELLEKQMHKYSVRLDFESAAVIRDQLKGLEELTTNQKMALPDTSISIDVLALSSNSKLAAVQLFQMRAGKLVGRLGFTVDCKEQTKSQTLQKVIEEHYSQLENVEIPQEIVIQYELPQQKLISEWLSEIKGKRVNLKKPIRSQKAELIELVERNSKYELDRVQKGIEETALAVEDLAQLLDMTTTPTRIEGFDISHIHGTDPVASQVVFIDGLPAKHHYRKYKIKDLNINIGHSDDYRALAEVIRRRFKRWSLLIKSGVDLDQYKSKPKSFLDQNQLNDWPDLIMIDGGKGQLSSVYTALEEIGLSEYICICSLAKRKEEIFLPWRKKPLSTDPNQIGVRLLRRIRDEAHRFAVGFHRQKRSERMRRSSLTEIPGVGPKRIRDVLSHFNSVQAIQIATIPQLLEVKGLGKSSAKQIYDYFHPQDSIQ